MRKPGRELLRDTAPCWLTQGDGRRGLSLSLPVTVGGWYSGSEWDGQRQCLAYPRQGPVLGVGQLHHQHLQHLSDALPADGSALVPLPPTWGTHLHLRGHRCPCAEQLQGLAGSGGGIRLTAASLTARPPPSLFSSPLSAPSIFFPKHLIPRQNRDRSHSGGSPSQPLTQLSKATALWP